MLLWTVAPYTSVKLPKCVFRTSLIEILMPSIPNLTKFVQIFDPSFIMQSLSLLLVSLLWLSVNAGPQMSDLQLERTLADRGIMQRHIRCALSEGPCDPAGIRLRTLAPLVLRGSCPQCSPQETHQIRRTLAFVQRTYPWEWAKIVRQYG